MNKETKEKILISVTTMLFRILVFQILSHIDYKIRAHRYCLQDIYIDQLLE